jgi:hypothetical protein
MGPACLGSSHAARRPADTYRHRSAAACQPMQDCSLLPVHKRVDDLCATAPILCIGGGNAGDSAA